MKIRLNYAINLFILIMSLLLLYSFIEPYWIEIKRINIHSKDIPKNFIGTRIVLLTDIHHGPFFSIARVDTIVQMANKLKPDIVIFGGDYVHRSKKYIIPLFHSLHRINAQYGKFGVLGNHDHWENADVSKKAMNKAEIKLLDNKSYWITIKNDRIKIGGVGDLWEDTQTIEPTIHDAKEKDFVIMVSHNPDYAEKISTNKIDVMLCGHTHGGQVTLFGLYAPFVPSKYGQKYRSGIIQKDNIKIIVSNGIGTVTPPVRFFARPQILVIELKK